MRYSLDTSSLIGAWRRHYPQQAFPSLWDKLVDLIQDGHLQATDEVRIELEKQDDEILEWAKSQDGLFVPIDSAIQVQVSRILSKHPLLVESKKGRSLADPFVIALASVHRCAVITEEEPSAKPNKPRIPDVCKDLGIKTLKLVDVIKQEGWKF